MIVRLSQIGRNGMKKWFFAASLVFVLAGLAVAASGYYPIQKTDQIQLGYIHNVPIQNRTDGVYYVIENTTIGMFIPENATAQEIVYNPAQWTVSANLTKGDLLDVWITQGLDWPEGIFFADEEGVPAGLGALYVSVNMTDPLGKVTQFEILLVKASSDSASSQFEQLTVYRINITDPVLKQAALDVSPFYLNRTNEYFKVGGIAQLNGTYTVRVLAPMPERKYPVTSIGMYVHVGRTEYASSVTLPAGITLSVVGIALSWVSIKKKPRMPHERTKRIDLKRQQ